MATFFVYGAMCLIIYIAALQYKSGDIGLGDISTFLLYMI